MLKGGLGGGVRLGGGERDSLSGIGPRSLVLFRSMVCTLSFLVSGFHGSC